MSRLAPINSRCHCRASKKRSACDLIRSSCAERCCHCADLRSVEEKKNPLIYLDGVGYVSPLEYGMNWPADIGYCPSCRHSTAKSAILYERLAALARSHPKEGGFNLPLPQQKGRIVVLE